MEKIDFVIATKNSGKTIDKCISSISEAIPKSMINKIIVVDNISSDDTIDRLRRLKHKYRLEIAREEGLLGKVRLRQAQLASTEWIVYIDSDVYIHKNWWRTISPYLTNDSGWVLGMPRTKYSEPYKSFFEWSMMRFGGIAFSNTAVRRKLVLEVASSLRKLHGNEDAPIFEHIKSQGYKAHFVKSFVGEHEGDKDNLINSKAVRAGQSVRIRKGFFQAFFTGFKLALTNQLKVLIYIIDKERDISSILKICFIQLRVSILFMKGILSPDLVRELRE